MNEVFVFGTLKEGFPNYKFNKGTRIGGVFLTKHSYPLFLVGERYIPWLLLKEGDGDCVKGQVFQVTDEALNEMDLLEDVSMPDGYKRQEMVVVSQRNGDERTVYFYGKLPEQLVVNDIKLKLSSEYTLEHALLYGGANR